MRVGFKTFEVRNGWFYLNGRRIFLKAAHTGNCFPIGLLMPQIPAQVRQDMILAKAAGFNTLRAISGVLRPEQLEICDEIGLIVYEECMASWCLGMFGTVKEGIPEMLERFSSCTLGMIRRDRHHACIGIFGLLNETMRDDPVLLHAYRFLPQVRGVDQEHLILFSSGSWEQDSSFGHVCNPHSAVWEMQWGDDGCTDKVKRPGGNYWDRRDDGWLTDTGLTAGDIHPYVEAPMSPESIRGLRYCGKDSKPLFVSESGIGSLLNVIEEWRHFEQIPGTEKLADCDWMREQSNKLITDWKRLGLDTVYPFPEWMLRESQRLSACDRLDLFDCIRSNPQICGYSLTDLTDHGWCGEGLWSNFRRMKPSVFDALIDGWSDLRFCLFVPPCVYAGENFTLEAVLANAGVLAKGTYTADFAVGSEHGIIDRFSQDFSITGEEMAVPVLNRTICCDAEGEYHFYATLRCGGAPMGREKPFKIFRRPRSCCSGTIAVCGVSDAVRRSLENPGLSLVPLEEAGADTPLFVGNPEAELLPSILKKVRDGARVFFADPGVFRSDAALSLIRSFGLPSDLTLTYFEDWLYHKEVIATGHPFLRDIPRGIIPARDLGRAFPHWVYMTSATPDEVILPAFQTGFYKPEGGYALLWAMLGFSVGAGTVYLNTVNLNSAGTEPLAGLMLADIASSLVSGR